MVVGDLKWVTTSATVLRETMTPDDYGDITTIATTETSISPVAVWQVTGNETYLAGGQRELSTHVMVHDPDAYTYDSTLDRKISYGGNTFRIVGRGNNVIGQDELTFVGLELIE